VDRDVQKFLDWRRRAVESAESAQAAFVQGECGVAGWVQLATLQAKIAKLFK
jgi:hypothetical protein